MKRYEIIDHAADIGLRAFGKDLKKLFANAACGMFSILADFKDVRPQQSVKIELEAPNIEELFLLWLSELLYQYNSKKILFREFLIEELTENFISAKARGEKIDLKRHRLKTEIKAATYHELKVQRVEDIWQAEVIFDV